MKRTVTVLLLILALSITLTGCGELDAAIRVAENFCAGWLDSSQSEVLETLYTTVSVREDGTPILDSSATDVATAFTSPGDCTGKLYIPDATGIDCYMNMASWTGETADVEMFFSGFKYARVTFDLIKSGDNWRINAINLVPPSQ